MTHPRRFATQLFGAAPFAVALVLELVLYAVHRHRLPTELASHFNASGAPDGFMTRGQWLTAVAAALTVAASGVVLAQTGRELPERGRRGLLAAGWGTAGLLGYLFGATLLAQVGLTDSAAARLTLWQLPAGLAAAGVCAAAGWLLAGIPVAAGGPAGAARAGADPVGERLALGPQERAAWSRNSVSLGFVAAVPAVALVASAVTHSLAGGLTAWAVLVPATLVTGLAVLLGALRVTVDHHGLTVASLLVPALRRRVPLERVESAVRRDIRPLEYGGWGYRVRPAATAVVLRGGPALVLRLTGGREFAVTVDDADTAAALLNTLADRRRTGREG
ncbi:DUF1648 domain-containing protein [Streptomyces griseiscabiei]|uniref:DUF1648 domain-containing protein n=1 Tax=Streptomyces griseiscabiei TaxID=2993540 RepID=A0ABU4LJD0_9ACTN|nr:DUF1648 domain-containing protein [Streptomyces griseiscabiei]MDX2915844.1 DUF1648 domain-containing protein [Streptomyces griseiscabiei]